MKDNDERIYTDCKEHFPDKSWLFSFNEFDNSIKLTKVKNKIKSKKENMKYLFRILTLIPAWIIWTLFYSVKWVKEGGSLNVNISKGDFTPEELLAEIKALNETLVDSSSLWINKFLHTLKYNDYTFICSKHGLTPCICGEEVNDPEQVKVFSEDYLEDIVKDLELERKLSLSLTELLAEKNNEIKKLKQHQKDLLNE